MRKPDFCLCENKAADQLRSNCEADQRLCFCYSDSTIPLLLIAKISSFQPSSVAAQADLCRKPRRPVFLRRGSSIILSTAISALGAESGPAADQCSCDR